MVDDDGAEVKALGPRAGEPVERRREHVLAGVLLHVLEAARPVDRARGTRSLAAASRFDHVQDRAVVPIDDVDDARAAERAGVERLAAGCRIERGAVEHDGRRPSCAPTPTICGVELGQVRIGVVETLGHDGRTSTGRRIGDAGLVEARARAGGNCRSGRTARPSERGS